MNVKLGKTGQLLAPLSFGLVLFLSSFLMFVIEPFIAKLLLPYLGGSANVWNTCVVFFQLTLILGYLYSHLITSRLSVKNQKLIHLAILLLPLISTSLAVPNISSIGKHPYIFLLSTLILMIGSLFFSLSTVAPLFQKWYSASNYAGSDDPYFLYSASNCGALLGLLCYPFMIEPQFGLTKQGSIINTTYLVVLVLMLGTIFLLVKTVISEDKAPESSKENLEPEYEKSNYWQWLVSAIIPASLVLGLTSYITSELSALPLFWIIPLFLYLLSFVIAFGRPPAIVISLCDKACPIAALAVVCLILYQIASTNANGSGFAVTSGISIHLIAMFLISVSFHGRLANLRPRTEKLTLYYLLIAIGGVIGSSINTFIAPAFLSSWIEYPLVLTAACILSLSYSKHLNFSFKKRFPDTNLYFLLIVITLCLVSLKLWEIAINEFRLSTGSYLSILVLAAPILVSIILSKSTYQLRLGVGISIFLIVFSLFEIQPDVVLKDRNFYGCLKVSLDRRKNSVTFWHGMTVHGSQSLDPNLRSKPEAYFHKNGPIGELFRKLNRNKSELTEERSSNKKAKNPIAIVGLGCGTLAAYGKPRQKMFFYELNPAVIDIANNPFYFTYLFEARKRGVDIEILEGDGRLSLQKAPYNYFSAIILDAFNSDSIPTHLMTKESMKLYISKLKKDGLIAFQVTNNYYNLKPQLEILAKDSKLSCLYKNDYGLQREKKRYPTEWVVMSTNQKFMTDLQTSGWKNLDSKKDIALWTDDYSNPLPLIISPIN